MTQIYVSFAVFFKFFYFMIQDEKVLQISRTYQAPRNASKVEIHLHSYAMSYKVKRS